MKIGLYGGTFDPPHNGHMKLAEDFYFSSGIDLLIVMPSFIPPHKAKSGTDAVSRLEMTRLACLALGEKGINYTVSAFEISKADTSYTIETVNRLLEIYNEEKIYLCIGSDMLCCLEKWKNAEELMKKCIIYSEERADGEFAELAHHAEFLRKSFGAEIHLMNKKPLELSSTELRTGMGGLDTGISGLVCKEVLEYIKTNRLYSFGQPSVHTSEE